MDIQEQIIANSNTLENQTQLQKNLGGRPTVMTAETIMNLIVRLQRGFSISEACEDIGIGERTFYDYQRVSAQFSQRVRAARAFYKLMAADVIFDVLQDHKRVEYDEETGKVTKHGRYPAKVRADMAKFVLERQSPEAYGMKRHIKVPYKIPFVSKAESNKM